MGTLGVHWWWDAQGKTIIGIWLPQKWCQADETKRPAGHTGLPGFNPRHANIQLWDNVMLEGPMDQLPEPLRLTLQLAQAALKTLEPKPDAGRDDPVVVEPS